MNRVVVVNGERFEYTLMRTQRSNVLFKVLPNRETRVFAPSWMHLRDVDALVRERVPKFREMQDELDRRVDADRKQHTVSEGTPVRIEGRELRLRISESKRAKLEINGGEARLSLPETGDPDAVRQGLREQLCKLALERIRSELEFYAPRLGVSFGRVTIREQKTRWGSCSSKHNLNFNWKLIMAPPEALRYVVIHELCHLIEFNHSARFWRLVGTQMPEYEAWKKWLKDHGKELNI